ncbi:VanZ family protein [Streptomyces ovatisporus]|uniref:VanZ family protein n=1 Tax=Streptomyces ovatisporus TaxID=1128682 RepID=A0ABV9A2M8_9ACTN
MQHHGRGGGTAAPAPRIRVAGIVLLTAYLAYAGWVALRPLSVPWVAPANLEPFATIRPALHDGSQDALTGLAGDLLLLAPLGVLMPLATGRLHRSLPGTLARTVPGGALISSLLALLQSGAPGHMVNVDSVLLNTAGVAITSLLVFPPVRAVLRRRCDRAFASRPGEVAAGGRPYDPLPRREDAGQGPTPRAAGVGIAP